jgi:hypothetical protein
MMKKLVLLTLISGSFILHAQDTRPANKTDVAFHNRVWTALKKALPQNFRDWDVTLPDKDKEEMREGDPIQACEALTCWRNDATSGTYDGSQTKNDLYNKSQEDAHQLQVADPEYVNKLGTIMNNFENATRLDVVLYVNATNAGPLSFCKPGGWQKLAPPTGWSTYYTSAAHTNCFPDVEEGFEHDISVYTMGVLPKITETKTDKSYEATLDFPLNNELMKTSTIQSIVLVIKGSKDATVEFLKMIDTAALQSLLK